MTVSLLKDNSNYTIYVSAESPMPYPPRLALDDANVLSKTFSTQYNPNLLQNEAHVVDTVRREYEPMAA